MSRFPDLFLELVNYLKDNVQQSMLFIVKNPIISLSSKGDNQIIRIWNDKGFIELVSVGILLTLCLQVLSANNLCKQVGPKSGPT